MNNNKPLNPDEAIWNDALLTLGYQLQKQYGCKEGWDMFFSEFLKVQTKLLKARWE
jgi:hypothetical protein